MGWFLALMSRPSLENANLVDEYRLLSHCARKGNYS